MEALLCVYTIIDHVLSDWNDNVLIVYSYVHTCFSLVQRHRIWER